MDAVRLPQRLRKRAHFGRDRAASSTRRRVRRQQCRWSEVERLLHWSPRPERPCRQRCEVEKTPEAVGEDHLDAQAAGQR